MFAANLMEPNGPKWLHSGTLLWATHTRTNYGRPIGVQQVIRHNTSPPEKDMLCSGRLRLFHFLSPDRSKLWFRYIPGPLQPEGEPTFVIFLAPGRRKINIVFPLVRHSPITALLVGAAGVPSSRRITTPE